MREVKISVSNILDVFKVVLLTLIVGILSFWVGILLYALYTDGYLFSIILRLTVGLIGILILMGVVVTIGEGISWVYRKDFTITLGGKKEKYKFPKARIKK